MHEGIAVWTLGVLLSLGAIYSGVRTRQRQKGSPKKKSDTVIVYVMAALILAGVAVLIVKA
jgi:hypothetical protein